MNTNGIIDIMESIVNSKLMANSAFIATVISPPPNLKLKYSEIEIYPEQIYCSSYLLPDYTRDYKLDGIIDSMEQEADIQIKGVNSSDMTQAGEGPHKHSITKVGGSGTITTTSGNYQHHGQLWLTDTLEVGDEVLTMLVGQYYVVTTRVVKMPNKAPVGGG